jgi:hypothetical protein
MAMPTGAEVRRVEIDSKFTHEVVRVKDRVYVCDTGNGRILELEFPSMKQVRGRSGGSRGGDSRV